MKKTLLTLGTFAIASSSLLAQNLQLTAGQATFTDKPVKPNSAISARPNSPTTFVYTFEYLDYFNNKHIQRNPPNTLYNIVDSSPTLNGFSSTFLSATSVTVTGAFAIMSRVAASPSATVAVKFYLYNVNASGTPTTKVDSANTTVTGTAAAYKFVTFTQPRVMSNYAIAYVNASPVAGNAITTFMNNASTPTSTVPVAQRYGESLSDANLNGNWISLTNAFGAGTDYEFVISAIVDIELTAGSTITTPSPYCLNANLTYSNTSTSLFNNRQYNLNKFAEVWPSVLTGTAAIVGNPIYEFNFGDGSTTASSNTFVTSKTFTNSGVFTGTLIANYQYADNTGADFDEAISTVTISGIPTLTTTPAIAPSACAATTGSITNMSFAGTPAFSYTWTNASATPVGAAANLTNVPAGNYSLRVQDASGCSSNFGTYIVINPGAPTTPTVTAIPASICAGASINLNATSGTGFTYAWSGPNSYTSSVQNPVRTSATTTMAGIYSVISTSAGCNSPVGTVTVTVNAIPTIGVNTSTAICSGRTFTIVPSGASTYTVTGGSLTVMPTVLTSYSVTGTSAAGCVGTNAAIITLSVNANPTITATASNTIICNGNSTTLTGVGGLGYLWPASNNTISPTVIVSPTVTTTYNVIGINSNNCTALGSILITVNPCTGINELAENKVSIFPNPNNGLVTISLTSALAKNSSIEIYDALGKLVIKQTLIEETNSINMSNLDSGIYIYKVLSNTTAISVGKLIKQ